jgi:hypothetical protein
MCHGKSRQLPSPGGRGFKCTMGKQDNSNYHGHLFLLAPWKVSKAVFPWMVFVNRTMGKPKNRFSMEEFPDFNHGKLEKINFHGQIFPLSPWKNPLNHFPWTETGHCSMEILIIKNTMDRLQKMHRGKTRNLDFHGRSSLNCPWNF